MPVEVLGIDFGTSNTVAVLGGAGRPPRILAIDGNSWMSSAIFVEDDGSLAVGRDAERKARLAPERFEANPKRRIDDGEILLGARVVPVVDAIAAVLRRVGEEARRQLNGRNPDQVHLTHPAQWGSARQNVLLAAARAAGLGGAIGLLPEPVAAATHFASLPGNSLPAGAALAVYDLGGGTVDCAVVGATATGFTVLAEAGLPDVGGVDFDQTIIDHLGRTAATADPGRWQALTRPRTAGDRRAARSLREDVRAAKETLSRYSQTDLPLPEPFEDTLLTRREFDGLIRPPIGRTVELLAGTIERAGVDPRRLAGIYLVGGSSRIPLVATAISEKLGVVASTLDQPETSVAMGAAISRAAVRPPGRTESLGPGSGRRPPAPGTRPPGAAAASGHPPVGGRPSSAAQRPPARGGGAGTAGGGPGSVSGPHAASVSGPHPGSVSGPHRASVSGPHRASVSGPHPRPATRAPRPGGRRRSVLLALAAAAAVAIAAVTVVLVITSGSDSAGDDPGAPGSGSAQQSGASSGASGSGTGSSLGDTESSAQESVDSSDPPPGPSLPATCATTPIDNAGMTPCLLAIAGPNADRAMICTPIPSDDPEVADIYGSVDPLATSGCTGLAGGRVTVIYAQYDSTERAITAFDAVADGLSQQSWRAGNGGGRYASDTPNGTAQIYWSYSGLAVLGFAISNPDSLPNVQPLDVDELTQFWRDSLLPQSE